MFDTILIDFSWLYNRYAFVAKQRATEQGLSNIEAQDFLRKETCKMLHEFLNRIKSSYPTSRIMLALDTPTSSLNSFSLFEGYKQNRDKEVKKDIYAPLKYIVGELSKDKDLFFIKADGYEADQVIAYIAEKNKDNKVLIYSGDKDLLQLTYHNNIKVSDKFEKDLLQLTYHNNIKVSDKFEKGKFLVKTDLEIFQKFKNSKGEDFRRISGEKRDILKYRVLKGDSSDNLSPVFPRIKDKEIISIIQEYWIDYEELTDVRINDIIDDIKGDNVKLAEKLEENSSIWLRNYKMMNIQGIEDLKLKRVIKKGE